MADSDPSIGHSIRLIESVLPESPTTMGIRRGNVVTGRVGHRQVVVSSVDYLACLAFLNRLS